MLSTIRHDATLLWDKLHTLTPYITKQFEFWGAARVLRLPLWQCSLWLNKSVCSGDFRLHVPVLCSVYSGEGSGKRIRKMQLRQQSGVLSPALEVL